MIPGAVVVQGIVAGAAASLLAVGLVVVHRATRIVNLAQAAIGVAGGVLAFEVAVATDLGFGVGLVLGIAAAGGVGALAGLLTLRFRRSGVVMVTLVTVPIGFAASRLGARVPQLPFFPPLAERTSAQLTIAREATSLLPASDWSVTVGQLKIPFDIADVVAVEIALVGVILAVLALRSRPGRRLDLAGRDPARAAAVGVGVGATTVLAWTVAGLLAGAAAVAYGLVHGPGTVVAAGGLAVLFPALAGAVLAGFHRPILAALATTTVQVAQTLWAFHGLNDGWLTLLVAGAVLAVVARNGDLGSWDAGAVTAHAAVGEAATEAVVGRATVATVAGGGRSGRAGGGRAPWVVAATVAVAATLPAQGAEWGFELSGLAIDLLLVLALVTVVGWAGIPTVAVAAWAAVGAAAVGLAGGGGTGLVWVLVLLAPVAGAAAAVVTDGIGAWWRRPEALVASLGLALAAPRLLAPDGTTVAVVPPRLGPLDLADERVLAGVAVVAVAAVALALAALARTRLAALVRAGRDDPALLAGLGRHPGRSRLVGLLLGGATAGAAGGLATLRAGSASVVAAFDLAAGAAAVVGAVLGGAGSALGAVLGGTWVSGLPALIRDPLLDAFLAGGGTLYLLFAAPSGLGPALARGARGVREVVAAWRRRAAVPPAADHHDGSEGLGARADLADAPPIATGAWVPARSVHDPAAGAAVAPEVGT